MATYILIGILWTAWLEYYTTTKITGKGGRRWRWIERGYITLVWPLSVGVFVYVLVRGWIERRTGK